MKTKKRRKPAKLRRSKPRPKRRAKPTAQTEMFLAPVPVVATRPRKTNTPAATTNFIRHWRIFRGIAKHGELAQRTGLTRPIISKLENGQQKYHQLHLEKIAHVLHTTPAALLGIDPLASEDALTVYHRLLSPPPRET